ncbi:type II secretion system F family protein [Streptomyces sp. TRM68367]|uniref:type II secretion system F family protein n=1 Tax=Streptomyces sp. TRM68367 TaxID=2758415 RepID=UPI00165A1F43|nr:type II secretion system F family protein [Streptomyces sp. TRM68367]MBC9731455.1 type II secretion system F family protein [Streptomyces sp. TRM68367]
MSVTTMVVCGSLAGAGVALLVREVVPSAPKLGPTLRRLNPPAPTPGVRPRKKTSTAWAGRLVERMPGTLPRTDLDLLNQTPEQFLVNKVSLALLGLLAPLVLVVGWTLMGLSVPLFLPGAVGVLAAIGLWFVPDWAVASEAAKARTEFAYAAAAYLDLVATRMASNVGPSQALEDAARIGRSWAFVRIQEALLRARTEKSSPWQALDDLGTQLNLPVLQDVADIMRLSSDDGASVYETLRNRAKSLSNELLAAEAAKANADSEKLSAPGALLAVIAMFLIAFPAVLNIFTI